MGLYYAAWSWSERLLMVTKAFAVFKFQTFYDGNPQPSALCRLLDNNIKGRVRSKYLPPFTLLPDSVSVGLDNNIESRESREVKVTSAGVWSVPLEVENKRTPHH